MPDAAAQFEQLHEFLDNLMSRETVLRAAQADPDDAQTDPDDLATVIKDHQQVLVGTAATEFQRIAGVRATLQNWNSERWALQREEALERAHKASTRFGPRKADIARIAEEDPAFLRACELPDDALMDRGFIPETNLERREDGLLGRLCGTEVWDVPPACTDEHIYQIGWEHCIECGPRPPRPAKRVEARTSTGYLNLPRERTRVTVSTGRARAVRPPLPTLAKTTPVARRRRRHIDIPALVLLVVGLAINIQAIVTGNPPLLWFGLMCLGMAPVRAFDQVQRASAPWKLAAEKVPPADPLGGIYPTVLFPDRHPRLHQLLWPRSVMYRERQLERLDASYAVHYLAELPAPLDPGPADPPRTPPAYEPR